jgi:hypothetical protein
VSSFVFATPEALSAASLDLNGVASTLRAANTAAAASITGVLPAAGDEVSAAIAAFFSGHAQDFQAINAQAAAFHSQFVDALAGAGRVYAGAEVSAVA